MNEVHSHSISWRKKIFFSIIILSVCVFILEAGARLIFHQAQSDNAREIETDDRYGWKSSANQHLSGRFGPYGYVRFTTTQNGFRVYGNVESGRPRILVLGDSQTQARMVSDGETYYDYLGRETDAEIFAYGAGGFGSLQEFMVLDDYYDRIHPDIIVWQFCANDLHNNAWPLEASSWENNNRMTRPYLEQGKIVYRFPHNSWLYRNLLRHSVLVQSTGINFGLALSKSRLLPRELLTEQNPQFREALAATREIMHRVKKRANATPVIAFSACSGRGGSYSQVKTEMYFNEISSSSGILYVAGIPDLIERAKQSGRIVDGTPSDAHWNGEGHRIAGEALATALRGHGLLDSKRHRHTIPR